MDHRLGGPGEAQHIADAAHQHPGAEGLGDIVVGPKIKAGDGAVLVAGGGEKDDGQVILPLDGPADSEAAAVREGDVQQS